MKREYKILTGGVFFTGLLYLIPSLMGYIWTGLFLSLFGATVYLIVLYKYGKKNFKENNSEKTTLTFFSLLVISSVIIFSFDYYKATFQREVLNEIRVTIDSSVIESEVRAELLEVYREYLLAKQESDISVTEVAVGFFGERLESDGKFVVKNPELEKDLSFLFHKDPESDSFSVYSVAEHSKSMDEDFENWDGSVGLLQTKTILTNKGVSHERQN